MLKRKKRSRHVGLGSATTSHVRSADAALSWGRKSIVKAKAAVSEGRCQDALFALTNARKEVGAAWGQVGGVVKHSFAMRKRRLAQEVDKLDVAVFKVTSAFIKRCKIPFRAGV